MCMNTPKCPAADLLDAAALDDELLLELVVGVEHLLVDLAAHGVLPWAGVRTPRTVWNPRTRGRRQAG